MSDAKEISRMLAGQVRSLVTELLPAGHREGNEWIHPSLTGTSRRSLSVRLSGSKAGVWADFAGGETGDALDLVATVSFQGDIGAALDWARGWLGIGDKPSDRVARPATPMPATDGDDLDEAARRATALRLFLAGREGIAGTPAAAYLAGRGIDLAELGRQPRSLRFHPGLWNHESQRRWPALVAAVTNDAGEMTAIHRTWLHQDQSGRWVKAPLQSAKRSLGRVAGGTIRLWRGASGRPLARAPAGEVVAVGEGIETCLSVAIACPELRVVSCVSLSNMANVMLPPTVHTVIVLKDNDGDNKAAQKALARAIGHFQKRGHKVRIAEPPIGDDFNDTLQAEVAE